MALVFPFNGPGRHTQSLFSAQPPVRYLDRARPAKRCIPCPVSFYDPNGWRSAHAATGEAELSWVMIPTSGTDAKSRQPAAGRRLGDRGPPKLALAIPYPPKPGRHRPLARQPMSGDLHAMYHIHDEGREWTDDASGLSSREGKGPPRCCVSTAAAVAPLALPRARARAAPAAAGREGPAASAGLGTGAEQTEMKGILRTSPRAAAAAAVVVGRRVPKRVAFKTGLEDVAERDSAQRPVSPYWEECE
ncbi:hypothetical protein RB595_009025 [Gaeumannomyces hyphopodioides]